MMYASLIGIGEIVLLPLDVLKIKRQTNPEAFRGRGLFKIISDEGMGLYRGAGWTAARNAPGSFAVSIIWIRLTVDTQSLTIRSLLALRRICFCQGIHLQLEGLQLGYLDTELCRLSMRCQCFTGCLCPLGRDQDPHPKPQLRAPRIGLPNRVKHV